MANRDTTLDTIFDETPLPIASRKMFNMRESSEELAAIDILINHDCEINATDDEGYSILHYAVQNWSINAVNTLLENDADVHLRTKKHKLTALHLAVIKENNLSIVESLIEAGAVIESVRIEELTPLQMSLLGGSLDVVDYLITMGADVNSLEPNLQFTPLHLAIYQQNFDLFELLIENGADVDCSGEDGLTPLHLSSMLGCPQFTKTLISLGAEVNCLYDNQFTPLHLATTKSHLMDDSEVIGADAITYGYEQTLIGKLLRYPYDGFFQDYEAVIRILVYNGAADVNAVTKSGWNALQYAVVLGRHPATFVDTLMELGADVHFTEFDSGFKPLHYALKNNYASLVKVLIDTGADVNTLTPDNKSPLHLALQSNCYEVLQLLIANGAKLNCKGKRCLYTLLYTTARNNDENMIDDLQDHHKTQILQVIDDISDRELKKELMCLCAIVDSSNESGCMSTNFEIQNDYVDISKSLRINRVNVHDSEVYSKFACDRVLSGALQELSYVEKEKQKPQYVYDYLSMLNAVKLPLSSSCITYSRTQSIADMYSCDKVKPHFNSCLDEVEKLKFYFLDEDVTLYQMLHMKPIQRRIYTKKLNLDEIESEFPIYYKLILARYREDVIRKTLMDTVQLAMNKFATMELPIICVEEIFADLGVMNMIAIIEAAEMADED